VSKKAMTNVELHRTIRAISITLDHTIAFYETYLPSGQDSLLINRVNRSDFYPAFNVISDALHREVILGLCRIWESRKDTANLNCLDAAFRDKKVLTDLMTVGHSMDMNALKKWRGEIKAARDSDELSALKRARDRALAHTASPNRVYEGNARVALFGDERKMLERTIPIVKEAGRFIGYLYVSPFEVQRQQRRSFAEKFWGQIGD
jgi:AbiU2